MQPTDKDKGLHAHVREYVSVCTLRTLTDHKDGKRQL